MDKNDKTIKTIIEEAENSSSENGGGKTLSTPIFTSHELETIKVFCQIILPNKEPFGGVIESNTPSFIEEIAREFSIIGDVILNGLSWLDTESNKKFNVDFIILTQDQQCEIIDSIAFHDPKIAIEEQPPQIKFFYVVRGLTLTGFYTSKIGITSLGYQGNEPNVWDGVPKDVLEECNMSYDDVEWIDKCINQNNRETIAVWDDDGNLLT